MAPTCRRSALGTMCSPGAAADVGSSAACFMSFNADGGLATERERCLRFFGLCVAGNLLGCSCDICRAAWLSAVRTRHGFGSTDFKEASFVSQWMPFPIVHEATLSACTNLQTLSKDAMWNVARRSVASSCLCNVALACEIAVVRYTGRCFATQHSDEASCGIQKHSAGTRCSAQEWLRRKILQRVNVDLQHCTLILYIFCMHCSYLDALSFLYVKAAARHAMCASSAVS